jgi:predicted ATPase
MGFEMKAFPYLQSFAIEKEPEEEYLRDIPAIRHMRAFQFHTPVTFFVGENGSGKSTLLEALAVHCGFNPEGGTRNFNFHTATTHSSLYKCIRLVRSMPFPTDGFFLRAESYYNVATEVDRLKDSGLDSGSGFMRHYGGKSLHEQSHGESFMALALHRFRESSIFFLDEPEAALSPSRQFALLRRIHELAGQHCQFIIATHSPILISCPGAQVYMLTEQGVELTPYQKTEQFTLMRQFVSDPERTLHYLLTDE